MDAPRRHNSVAEPSRLDFSRRHALEDAEWYSSTPAHDAPPYTRADHINTNLSHETAANARETPHPSTIDGSLPSYSPSDELLPTYAPADPFLPLQSYTLLQISRSVQVLLPSVPSIGQPTYRLIARSSPKVFSKKADITLVRSSAVSHSRKIEPRSDVEVVRANYNEAAILPWMPRGFVTKVYAGQDVGLGAGSSVGKTHTLPMESRNFRDWTLKFTSAAINQGSEPETKTYIWRLTPLPIATFTLEPLTSATVPPIATFSHTDLGTLATSGAAVGTLDVHALHSMPSGPDVEMVMGSLALVMRHFKRMGRQHYSVARGFDHFGADTGEVRRVGLGIGRRRAEAQSLSVV